MSIFGVFGCTLLLFACFGMLFTMNNYIEVNYNVLMNYASCLSVSDSLDNVRAEELATLKVLGFKNKKIRSLLIRQNMALSIIGIAFGCPIGYYVLVAIYKLLASEYELKVYCAPYTYIVSIVLTLAVSFAVSVFTSLKVKKINMVESLKAE